MTQLKLGPRGTCLPLFANDKGTTKEKGEEMKTRTIAVMWILALAAWLPLAAQQTATPATNAPQGQDQNPCACCDHRKDQDKDASKDMTCCRGKDSCCSKKDAKTSQAAMNCCAGKDGAQCAKDGKDCCGKGAKQGCCHNAMASNAKDAKHCCAGHGCCARNASES